jgi:hypothetical protein
MNTTITLKTWVLDTIEKAGITALQALLVLIPTVQVWDNATYKALVAAGIFAVLNVFKQALTFWIPTPKSFVLEVVVRALWTFGISILGVATAGGVFDLFSATAWRAAAVGGLMAAAAVVKGLIARRVSGPLSQASLMPKPDDTPPPPAA